MPVKIVREFLFHEALDASSTKAFGPSDDEKANCFSSKLLGIWVWGNAPALAQSLMSIGRIHRTPELGGPRSGLGLHEPLAVIPVDI